jgi:hypothetical protein
MLTLKEMVSDNKKVAFVEYRQGNLWYSTEDGFKFPVPVGDIGGATFAATEKALLMMRYMRKHLDTINTGKKSNVALSNL